jgi:hypothetical protein
VGASLEHLVQCSIANPAVPPDHIASLDKCVVQAKEPARGMTLKAAVLLSGLALLTTFLSAGFAGSARD